MGYHPTERPVLEAIVEQHAEEAAFLWFLRDRAVEQPHYAVRHLRRLDERVEAHLDGLRVAGEAGWRIAAAQLEASAELGELFAAGVLALERGDAARIDQVVEVARHVPDARRGLIGAIAWCPSAILARSVRAWEAAADPFLRYLAVCACSVHRADPGQHLAGLLVDPDPFLRARALRLAGELGRADLLDVALRYLDDAEPEIAFWSAWSAVLLGDRGLALRALEAVAVSDSRRRWIALEVAGRAMGLDRGARWARALNGDLAFRRLVTILIGHLGDPVAIPWLIGRMADPELARVAGESFSMITGVDLAYDDLERDAPADRPEPANDDPADERTALDPDEHLPWPDPTLVQGWWDEHAQRFTRGARHLLGRPIDAAACDLAWREGFQRQRRAASYELVVWCGAKSPSAAETRNARLRVHQSSHITLRHNPFENEKRS